MPNASPKKVGTVGFKANTSFLKYLSMGAIGARQTMNQLRIAGFRPIELERYCTSNKLWLTKVKRLRLPDVLCVRTGMRLEVRAKSDLRIKMSDAPNNPQRRWDCGLRDNDLTAFIAINDQDGVLRAADSAVFFRVKELRESVETSQLGTAKAPGEGAERDRTWPAIIPPTDGRVIEVGEGKIKVEFSRARGSMPYTYPLNTRTGIARHPYVGPEDTFKANVSIIAGTPERMADLAAYLTDRYNPLECLQEADAIDRYAAIKAIPYREDCHHRGVQALEQVMTNTAEEPRVSLEAAGSAARLGSQMGEERLVQIFNEAGEEYFRMEVLFILTELRSQFAKTQLASTARNPQLAGSELRQAAIWGLGKAGLKAYEELLPFIADEEENVAMHSIVAFGSDTPENVIETLVQMLGESHPRRSPAASEALRLIANEATVRSLIRAATAENTWAIATLGRLPSQLVKPLTDGTALQQKLAPMLLLSEGANWLANEDRVMDLGFLTKQDLY